MKFKRDEILGMAIAVIVVAGLFALVRFDVWSLVIAAVHQENVTQETQFEDVVVLEADTKDTNALARAFSTSGTVDRLVVQDVTVGEGTQVEKGSRVAVQYVGMLQNGITFKDTYREGESYRFTLGMGDVIEGWEQGLVGMREGGKRILVVPPALGYGTRALNGIPANSTLLFSIELISVE